jgi:hypothetical protein
MRTRKAEVAELIRRVLNGDRVLAAKRALVAAGPSAVVPVLEAATGGHGRPAGGRHREALSDLVHVLERIARKDARPLAAALAHDQPGLNMVAWALGHSGSRHAQAILKGLVDHEDGGVRAVARYHLERGTKRRTRARARKA